MRYFAEVENGIVQRVSIGESPDTLSASFTWVETFLDGGSRRNMAVAGGNYNSENDVFYAEQPYDSWTLNTSTWEWEAPSTKPEGNYVWNETDGAWVEVTSGGLE